MDNRLFDHVVCWRGLFGFRAYFAASQSLHSWDIGDCDAWSFGILGRIRHVDFSDYYLFHATYDRKKVAKFLYEHLCVLDLKYRYGVYDPGICRGRYFASVS